jgi:hypothetical protein
MLTSCLQLDSFSCGRKTIVISNCSGIKEEWENPNLCKLQKYNVITKKGSYPLPFIDDVLNIVVGHDACSFLEEYF